MKACVLHGIRDLRYEDRPEPVLSNDDELILRILRGGICGSDMHYYTEGGVGAHIKVKHPLTIGHEGYGIVEKAGKNVTHVKPGDRVFVRPARPCFDCKYCRMGMYTYCENMRHHGSAVTDPHVEGLFAEKALAHRAQVFPAGATPAELGAFAEPLGVAYGGVAKLGKLFGKNVLVMGAGPIGSLCVAAARVLGADSVTAVDVQDEPLAMAKKMGADVVCNSKTNPDAVAKWKEHKGWFDAAIEASGNKYAVADAVAMLRPEGILSQVGSFGAGAEPLAPGLFQSKGIVWNGVFRFYDEFPAAVRALASGWIDPRPLLSGAFPAEKCVEAMEAALRPDTSKIQVVFAGE